VNYAVTRSVFEAFYFDPRYRPSLIQRQHVDAGWLGRKSGRGYYDYTEKTTNRDANHAESAWILDRILAMLINEAADALYLGIASSQDLETAMTKGVNYPKGLLVWANEIGLQEVVNILDGLHARYGEDRYRASVLLRDLATEGKLFNC
jgi:3-hydroxybutyryl-CoA dehydrogenase